MHAAICVVLRDNEASDGSYGVFSEYDVWEIYLAGFRSEIFPKTFEWKSFCCALSSPNLNLRNTRAEYNDQVLVEPSHSSRTLAPKLAKLNIISSHSSVRYTWNSEGAVIDCHDYRREGFVPKCWFRKVVGVEMGKINSKHFLGPPHREVRVHSNQGL
jgi:hypothetical protein